MGIPLPLVLSSSLLGQVAWQAPHTEPGDSRNSQKSPSSRILVTPRYPQVEAHLPAASEGGSEISAVRQQPYHLGPRRAQLPPAEMGRGHTPSTPLRRKENCCSLVQASAHSSCAAWTGRTHRGFSPLWEKSWVFFTPFHLLVGDYTCRCCSASMDNPPAHSQALSGRSPSQVLGMWQMTWKWDGRGYLSRNTQPTSFCTAPSPGRGRSGQGWLQGQTAWPPCPQKHSSCLPHCQHSQREAMLEECKYPQASASQFALEVAAGKP